MMKELYTSDDAKCLTARMWKFAAICISLAAVVLGVGIATCFFVNDDNATWLKVLDIVLGSVCGCVALYLLFNGVIPARARRNYINKMLASPSKTVRGKVTGKGKKITVVKHMDFSELHLIDENGKQIILYSDNDTDGYDYEGHVVEFKVVNNKIVGYGDAQ